MISARLCIVYSHHLKISSSIGTLLCESINTHTLIHAHDGNMCVCLIDFQISEHGDCFCKIAIDLRMRPGRN